MDGFSGRQIGETEALAHASEGLAWSMPEASAKRVTTPAQMCVFGLIAAFLCVVTALFPHTAQSIAYAALLAVFATALTLRLWAAAAAFVPAPAPPPAPGPLPVLTVLCPLYKEAAVAPDLVAALQRLDYPPHLLDVKLILEADDEATIAAIAALDLPDFCALVIVPTAAPRTKPKALNYALAFAHGDIVTVFDAEDRPHPSQPKAAIAAFAAGGAGLACVQAPLRVDNAASAWIARQFAAEYAFQFAALLPFLARLGLPFPLGGTSNYFRLSALRACGGWDPYNVTEDADIGYRLARQGWRMGAVTPPTMEEAPVTFGAWRRQRTRWIKGHLQTWLVLMRNPAGAMKEPGLVGFAAMQIALGGGLLAAFLHGPIALALVAAILAPGWASGWTLSPLDAAFVAAGYATGLIAVVIGALCARQPSVALAAVTAPLYWPLASWAALCALGELVLKPHYWAKTAHGLSARGSDPNGVHPSPDALRLLPRPGRDARSPRRLPLRAPH